MLIQNIVPTIADALEKNSADLPSAISQILVFGSHARGTATLRSDVDLAIVYANESDENRKDRAMLYYILDSVIPTIEIQLFGTTYEKIKNAKINQDANYGIKTEGRIVWERTVTSI